MIKLNLDPPLSLLSTPLSTLYLSPFFASSFLPTLHPSFLSLFTLLLSHFLFAFHPFLFFSTAASSFLHLFSVLKLLDMFPTTFSFLIIPNPSILLSLLSALIPQNVLLHLLTFFTSFIPFSVFPSSSLLPPFSSTGFFHY